MRKLVDWPAEQYFADREHVSNTWLTQIHRSPAHLRAYLDGEVFPSADQDIGSLAHSWVLEPETIESRYIRAPKMDRRTKAGKELYAELQEDGRQIVMADDWNKAMRLVDAVYSHAAAATLLDAGEPEKTVIWRDADTGLLCKARADWLRDGMTLDVKTTRDASAYGFAKSVAQYKYHQQAAHYLDGFRTERFVWVAVEKEPPYAVAVYEATEDTVTVGRELRDHALRLYAECLANDRWPGYGDEVQPIYLPRWAA